MKASELRELGREGIRRRLAELEDELFKLKLRRATEPLPNPLRLRVLRREIARCHTVLRELELKEKEREGRNA